jgi:hypothetical protein
MKMNPVLVLIVLFLGHHAFGIWGVLLAVPVTHYFITHVAGVLPISPRRGLGKAGGRGARGSVGECEFEAVVDGSDSTPSPTTPYPTAACPTTPIAATPSPARSVRVRPGSN